MASTVTVVRNRPAHPGRRLVNTSIIVAAPVEQGPQAPQYATTWTGLGGWGSQGNASKIVAQSGRVALGLGGQITPVRKVAQIGRTALGVGGWSQGETQGVAGSFTHVVITRNYDLATGEAPTGKVWFTPSEWMTCNSKTVPAAGVAADLDADGQISISLAANTDPATVPGGVRYVIREEIVGQPRRTYKVQIPHNSGLTLDLSTLPVIS